MLIVAATGPYVVKVDYYLIFLSGVDRRSLPR
jgi:hypothetical protein